MDDGLSGLGRRSALALVAASVSGLATIATLLIASRSLTKESAGEFFVAISLFAIVQGVCSFGTETGLQYFIPTMGASPARRLIASVVGVSTVAGVLAALLVGLVAGPFGHLLAEGDAAGGGTTAVIRSTALVLPFAGLYEVTTGALRACDRVFVSMVLDRVLRPIAQVVAMLAVAIAGGGSRGMVYAWALPNVATVLVTGLLLLAVHPRVRSEVEHVSNRQFWGYTGPRSVSRIAQTLTQRLDVIILAAVSSIEAAGVYGAVSRCMIAGVFIATAVRQAVQPQLRRLIVRGDQRAVKNLYGTSTTWLVMVTWPAYLVMITHAPLVMRAFGPGYVRGSTALVLLCSAMLVASACGLVDVVLLMLGRSWLSTVNVLLALALNVVLNLVLAPPFGMVGSAVAWVVAILTTNLLPLAQTSRVGLHPGGRPLAVAMALAVGAIALPLAVERALLGVGLAPFLITYGLTLVAYVVGLGLLRREVLLDRLVSDLRHPRRRAVAHG